MTFSPFRRDSAPSSRPAGPVRWGRRGAAALVFAALLGLPAGARPDASAVPASGPAEPAALAQPTADVRELQEWLDAKAGREEPMPLEARLAYRRGAIAWRSGEEAKAITLMRGAAQLDPSYVAPQLTLSGWFLLRQPSQALQSGAVVLDRLRKDFTLQLELAGNALFYAMHALFFGILAAALILVGRHHRELRHGWRERLEMALSARSARVWSWVFLTLPFALGFGLALPAMVMFAMLWPTLRSRERAVFLGLVLMVGLAPLAPTLMGRLAMPLRADLPPFYGVQRLENGTFSADRRAEVAELARQHPDDPFLQFGSGWMARRAGDVAGAQDAYRAALQRWPDDDRVLNNLGNLLAMQGRLDEALACYQKATARQPRNAAAYFNTSQVYTRRFDYRAASDAIAKASALDFEMVKAYQTRAHDDLPLVDQWIAPARFWRVLGETDERAIPPALPPAWGALVEMSGWSFTVSALILTALGFVLGLWWHRGLPVRGCSNCAAPLCRRCAHRQREQALCTACAATVRRAETPEFGRVLLLQRKRRIERLRSVFSTTLATLVPGLGLVASRRIFYAIGLLMIAALLASSSLSVGGPFPLGQDLLDTQGAVWSAATAWLLLYSLSILGFLGRRPEVEPPASKSAPLSRGAAVAVPEPPARAA